MRCGRERRLMRFLRGKIICGCCLAVAGFCSELFAGAQGDSVAVIFNSAMPESKELAFYYAQRRAVPTNQVLGQQLPATETMTRAEFRDQLQRPLVKALERLRLVQIRSEIIPATRERTGDAFQRITDAKVRYATLCYGVPVKISRDPNLSEPVADKTRIELRRNEAAVDS